MFEKGYVQLYTGNGKGKTTASLGLTLRAAGAGLKSVIIQFMKGQHYSELDAVSLMDGFLTIEQFGSGKFCRPENKNYTEHLELAEKGYKRAKEVLESGTFKIVVLDEIVTTLSFKLLTVQDIIDLIRIKPADTELIITGRGAPEELIEKCDLVTEMKEIKHYYTRGVMARKGIEN
jgi:cob(I)alamin adenosyltransferase